MSWKRSFLSIAITAVIGGCQGAAPETSQTAAAPPTAPRSSEEIAQAVPDLLPNLRQPGDGIISGGQPTPEQLAAARDAGYKTVVNFRLPEERGIGDEPDLVSELGMTYISVPIKGAAGLTRENVELFAETLETAEYPVVLHCGSGNRIGALFALKAFWLDGKSADEALQIGIDSGLTRLAGAVKQILAAESSVQQEEAEQAIS